MNLWWCVVAPYILLCHDHHFNAEALRQSGSGRPAYGSIRLQNIIKPLINYSAYSLQCFTKEFDLFDVTLTRFWFDFKQHCYNDTKFHVRCVRLKVLENEIKFWRKDKEWTSENNQNFFFPSFCLVVFGKMTWKIVFFLVFVKKLWKIVFILLRNDYN